MFQDKDFDEKEFLEGAKDAFFMGTVAYNHICKSCSAVPLS